MPPKTTRRQAPKGTRAKRVIDRKPTFQGWKTTDEEEIERRRQRALTEPMEIRPLEPEEPVFGSFRVASGPRGEPRSVYEVEIRSLAERRNSCACPDHRVNGLGTCKHVEAVVARLAKKLRRRLATTAEGGSARVEIFLRSTAEVPRVEIAWPVNSRPESKLRDLLAPYFSADGTLLADPLAALPALERRLAAAPAAMRARVRVSRHLPAWLAGLARRARQATAKQMFLADVAAGKRSLNLTRLPLYPYQQEGAMHLAFTERALLGDEMGLGKTVQAIAACELLRQMKGIERVLVISPASLKGEWEEQIGKFTGLPAKIIYGPRAARLKQYREPSFFYLTNYEQVVYDGPDLQELLAPDVVILDEAQRIKNWQTKTAEAVKRLASPYAFVLTGTPLENRIDDIYSIVQFLDPGILGPLFRFNRDFYRLNEDGRPEGYQNLGELHRRLKPVMLRRRKSEVEGELPGRTVNTYFVGMEPEQKARYEEYNERVARLVSIAKRRPLTADEFEKLQRWLACMRMLCDTPYILDRECRLCPKLGELEEILGEQLAEEGTKVLIFSEWERMLHLVRDLVQEMGVGFAWHTGSVPQPKRREEIRRFKDSPDCRLFLSSDSGSVGLNLQAANVVINLDLPWNPARLEQRIARAWRKHQTRSVQVIHLVTEHSIEHRMMHVLAGKLTLAAGVLDGQGDLDNVPMPSGRKAFMARLEQVLGTPVEATLPERLPQPKALPEPAISDPAVIDPALELRQDLQATLGEGLLLLEKRRAGDGTETLLAVVEGTVAGPVEASAREAGAELIDRATYETILRLAERGLLQLAPGAAETLHRSPSLGDPARREREQRLERARVSLNHAERKLKMATLLANGGFAAEALPALSESLDYGLHGLAALAGTEVGAEGPLTISSALSELLLRHTPEAGPAIALRNRQMSTPDSEEISGAQVQSWVNEVEALLRLVEEGLSRAALGGQ